MTYAGGSHKGGCSIGPANRPQAAGGCLSMLVVGCMFSTLFVTLVARALGVA